MDVSWNKIESRWRAVWDEGRDFESEPDDKPKKFITVAYPYPNSPQHIGHGRTYTLADVHARFYRMRGYNVLFPMGFHYTGTPVLGMAKRIEAGEKEILDGLRNIYHVPDYIINTFVEPVKIADYFREEIKAGMIEMGYSIDWRREFTTIDPGYSKFVQWQITTLKESGRIIQGSHPVGWCPRDQNPVSQHDTMGDIEPKIDDKNRLIRFTLGKYILPVTTLRPETIFGVTNLWINPGTVYKEIIIDGREWIVSEECARVMGFLGKDVTIKGDVNGSDLVGKVAVAPHSGQEIPILKAGFVDPNVGTGIVMSVPAHAPKDYQALADLKAGGDGAALDIEPIPIIVTDGYGKIPAMEMCQNISDQHDQGLEEATSELYLKEFTQGNMNDMCGDFAGDTVKSARDRITDWLAGDGHLEGFPVLENGPVRCRCGAQCVVKILDDQWFLNYGDESWKDLAKSCLGEMDILPNKIRTEFNDVIDWLHERACARQHGLGTRLPWDANWIVESLSDSVIYMAYYTISRFVNDGTIPPDSLTREFFDYIFLGAGDIKTAAAASGLSPDIINAARREFAYFYPVDSRHSGRDLVQNHLSFFVLNHVAIFDKELWPREIVVNGSVMMNGAKMSKSMGNIIPLRAAIREYGADPVRLAIISSAELLQDADFDMDAVSVIQNRLESIIEECARIGGGDSRASPADAWMIYKMQDLIVSVTEAIEKMRLREALHDILFAFESDLKWHAKRAESSKRNNSRGVMRQVFSARVAMLAPFAPHAAEEMWERLGYRDPVSKSRWPEYSKNLVDMIAVQSEELLRNTIKDIANIIKATGITPKRITVYVSSNEFKTMAYYKILRIISEGRGDMGTIMKKLISDPQTTDIKKEPDFVQKVIRDLHSESDDIIKMRLESEGFDEASFLAAELAGIGKTEFGADVTVYSGADSEIHDPRKRAALARPFKPAILVE